MTPERLKRISDMVDRRQFDLTILLENVHDPHNIGAVLRTCDSIGLHEIYILYTDPLLAKDKIKLKSRSASGSLPWLKVNYYTDLNLCVNAIKEKYHNLYSTHLSDNAIDLYKMDLTQSMVLVFGNEHRGVSPELQSHCDGNFLIPQTGMVQSLNISVACAVSLYEAFRQRNAIENIEDDKFKAQKTELLKSFIDIHGPRNKNKYSRKINP